MGTFEPGLQVVLHSLAGNCQYGHPDRIDNSKTYPVGQSFVPRAQPRIDSE